MATLHYRNAKVEVNGTDLSSHFTSVGINYASEMLDETAMGDSTRIRKGGLKTWSFDLQANQDFASGALDAVIFPLVGTTACFEIRPQNICATVSNPRWSGIGIIESYNPLGGDVGTLLTAPVTVQSASDLDRSTAAS